MRPLPPSTLQRCTLWVLAAWLCVVLGTALSPLARAQTSAGALEPVCGMGGMPHWVVSPAAQLLDADEGMALPHGLDCPLCLPLLAPPSGQAGVPVALPPQVLVAGGALPAPWAYRVAAPLSARGPPADILFS